MPDPTDLLKAWQDAIRDVGGAAASLVSRPVGAASELIGPLQQQAEQLERVLQRQLEFERELVTRAIAPAKAAVELVGEATVAFRAQATALRAAANSFAQLADLMEQQAQLVERAGAAIRDPVAALRAAGVEIRGEQEAIHDADPAGGADGAKNDAPTSGGGRARGSGGPRRR